MKKTTFFILLFIIANLGYSQSGSISGVVKDSKNQPLPGVNILLEGTKKGTTSDFDGNYIISNVEEGTFTVFVSYIGFKNTTYNVKVESGNSIQNIILEEDLLMLDQVVVTGSSNPKTKLQSSIAVTTMSANDIEAKAPNSTADLLQSIPGFLVESSGGEVGNNLFARGIPSAGAYEYVQIQEDGLPVFEDGALQFANIDNFQRVDLTVKSLEAVKGGSAAIFASGAPGGIINFTSKTGQNEFKGITKLTVGDYGLFKTDFNLGGAVVEDKLFFNIGGFYRVDKGVRDPGFDANKGGQIKMNFTYKFDKGHARIFYKNLNDRNIFYQSTPFVMKDGKVKEYPGFDANYGTFTSVNFSKLRVPQGGGGFFEADLSDGVHPKSTAIGGEFKYKINDNVKVQNNFKSTNIDLDYNAIYAAQWMGDVTSQNDYATGLSITNPEFTYNDGGAALASGTELKRADYWFINKKMKNFANSLKFSFKMDKSDLTVGHYYSNWKSDQNWNWSSFLVSASDNPRLVNLVDSDSGLAHTYNGITGISWLQRESQIQNTTNALFADFETDLSEKLTLNVGLRYDMQDFRGVGDHGTWGNDLGVLDNNTADDGSNILRGNYVSWKYDVDELSYSGALNYQFSDKTASYLRYSHSFRAPIEESFYGPAIESGLGSAGLVDLEPTKVNQLELGYKYSSPKIAIFANAFFMKLDNIAYQDIGAGGVSEKKFANVQNLGLEIETILKLGKLNMNFNGTLQSPEYKGYEGSETTLNGNTARRISKFYFTYVPSYSFNDKLDAFISWSYFGDKYQDIANNFKLPGFSQVNLGASYKIDNVKFGLDVSNLFNAIGLTEADGLQSGVAPVNGQTFMGRSILGRSAKLSIAINF